MRKPIGSVGDGRLVITRRYAAPVETVWACLTEPDHLGRWYGRWTGDRASGRVLVQMSAEVTYRRNRSTSGVGTRRGRWRWTCTVRTAPGGST